MGRTAATSPLMSAIAGGADYVLIPEVRRPDPVGRTTCRAPAAGRAAGRRDSIVIVAEGARRGRPADQLADYVRRARGATRRGHAGHHPRPRPARRPPSAYDRWMSTLMGHAAVLEVLGGRRRHVEPQLIGIHNNRIPDAADGVRGCDPGDRAHDRGRGTTPPRWLRGGSFTAMMRVFDAGSPSREPMFPGQGRGSRSCTPGAWRRA
jgi:6-phosphofructokinase 1